MKLLIAMVQSDKVSAIQDALKGSDAYVMYVSTAGDVHESILGTYRGADYREPRPRMRVEIVVMIDLAVQETLDLLIGVGCAAGTNSGSNGSIFVVPLDDWIRIPATPARSESGPLDRKYSVRDAS
jgi:nitrogen regulatory protein PII